MSVLAPASQGTVLEMVSVPSSLKVVTLKRYVCRHRWYSMDGSEILRDLGLGGGILWPQGEDSIISNGVLFYSKAFSRCPMSQ